MIVWSTIEYGLKRYGYKVIDNKFGYWGTLMYGKGHCVCVYNNQSVSLASEQNIEQIRQSIKKVSGCSDDKIGIIVTDPVHPEWLSGKNVICVTLDGKTICHGLTSEFKEVLLDVKEVIKDRRCVERYTDAYLGNFHGQGTSIYLFVIAATMFITFYLWDVGKQAGISYDILTAGGGFSLLTYMFAHSNLMHLIRNMFSLFIIGKEYCKEKGWLHFMCLYILGGAFAGAGSAAAKHFLGMNTSIPTIGASGAIFAIFGALIMKNIIEGELGVKQALVRAGCVLLMSTGLRVDNFCHVAGFIFGMWYEFCMKDIPAEKDGWKKVKALENMRKRKIKPWSIR